MIEGMEWKIKKASHFTQVSSQKSVPQREPASLAPRNT